MNNQKTQNVQTDETTKESAIKKLAGIKGEASSLSAVIKKCLSHSVDISKKLKSRVDTLKSAVKEDVKAEENSKNSEPVVKVPEIKPAQIAKPTVIANKPVSDSKLSSSGFKFGKPGTPDTSIRTRHFNHDGNARPMERGQRTMQPRDGQRPTFNNGTRPQFACSQNRFNNGTRPFGQNTKMQGGMVAAGTVKGSRPIQSAGQASAVSSFVAQGKPKADFGKVQQTKKKSEHSYEEKKSLNRRDLIKRGFIADESLENEDGVIMGSRKIKGKKAKQQETIVAPAIDHAVITTDNLTVKLLAEKIGKPVVEIIKKFMILGNMVNINSQIDFDSAELIASEFGVTLEQKLEKTAEEQLSDIKNINDDEKDLIKRPPVVTVLGHVDHGKTSLLDYIRETNVIDGEAGGITQHIGAYTIEKNGELITFIDTPGHAAFTAMRARGAELTDIAILVVAADDGVMPQTIEAIKEIKAVKAPMIVAINKIDKPEANIDRIKQQLTEHDVIPEEWGGDAIIIPISAKTGQNIDKLLEMILFVAEYQNLRANPNRKAIGSVIEAKLDKGKGPVATILVQNGTLKVGDVIIAGTSAGKVRAMLNEKGKNVKSAGPSFAVSVLGLSSVPNAGDEMYAVDEKMSKKVLSERMVKEKTDKIKAADNSVDALMDRFKETEYKNYNVIIKADVQGSLEALTSTLNEIMNEEVKVRCIHGGVGAINENDVMMAQASNAIIVGFNTKPDFKAKVLADKYKVNILFNKIIYEVVDYVTNQINAMKTPKYKENITGKAEIRAVFKASKVGAIAGCYILDGKLSRGQQVRVYRKKDVIFNGNIATIQREKDEVKDISAGFECGIVLKDFSQIQIGDIIEGITLERIN